MHPPRIIILGAGLTGLSLAYFLKKEGIKARVLEARPRLGGRIFTDYADGKAPLEMGATWLGRKHETLVRLLKELDLPVFEQILGEQAVYEYLSTSPAQIVQLPKNDDPSFRIAGGSSQLIETLASQLDEDQIILQQFVKQLVFTPNEVQVYTQQQMLEADYIISTLPPNLLVSTIEISPKLPEDLISISKNTHTWMGESIKVGLRFQNAFWRKPGLSGTIFSNVGPVSEMYDHANIEDTHFAMKGFFNGAYHAIPKEDRATMLMTQLRKYYGNQLDQASPSYHEYVWRNDPLTFQDYQQSVLPHQHNGHPIFRKGFFDQRFFIAGAETADLHPGYMDGAVRSAQWVFQKLLPILS